MTTHYYPDNFKAFCYYFVDAPGGFEAIITAKAYYYILHFILWVITLGILPTIWSREYKESLDKRAT